MGLSGRKEKQRIPNDPRNLGWADDAARFGSSYLSKFGWDPSKGLGAAGDGRISHLKVSQKLDMLGIGAAQQRDPNGIAWKQNRDFENLLKRLNEASSEDAVQKSMQDVEMVEDTNGDREEGTERKEKQEKKKRKKDKEGVTEAGTEDSLKKEKKKKRKGKGDNDALDPEDGDKREKKKHKKNKLEAEDVKTQCPSNESSAVHSPVATQSSTPSTRSSSSTPASSRAVSARPVSLRHRAHRTRAIAAKNISSKSSAAIAEILGIASNSTSAVASAFDTPVDGSTPTEGEVVEAMEKLTTSTKSVSDYFKEKLLMKSKSGTATPAATATASLVRLETVADPWDDAPTRGLGSSMTTQLDTVLTETERTSGIGNLKFSRHLSTMFASPTTVAAIKAEGSAESEDPIMVEDPEETTARKEKKKKRKGKERDVEAASVDEPTPSSQNDGEGSVSVAVPSAVNSEALSRKETRREKRKQDAPADKEIADESNSKPSKEERRRRKAERTSKERLAANSS